MISAGKMSGPCCDSRAERQGIAQPNVVLPHLGGEGGRGVEWSSQPGREGVRERWLGIGGGPASLGPVSGPDVGGKPQAVLAEYLTPREVVGVLGVDDDTVEVHEERGETGPGAFVLSREDGHASA